MKFLAPYLFILLVSPLAQAINLKYDNPNQCSAQELSLEENWNDFLLEEFFQEDNRTLPQTCVLYSMNSFEHWANSRAFFGQCSAEDQQPKRIKTTQCKTESLVSNLNNTYNTMTDCFNIPAKYFYTIMSTESGFFLNAYAPGKDAGLGQLTPPGIQDVNMNWDSLIAPVMASNKDSCKQLQTWVEELRVAPDDIEQSCQFIATPKNPARNLLYGLMLFQQNRKYFTNFLSSDEIQNKLIALLKVNLTKEQTDHLVSTYSLMSYNMGFVRLTGVLNQFFDAKLEPVFEIREDLLKLSEQMRSLEAEVIENNNAENFKKANSLQEKLDEAKDSYVTLYQKLQTPILNFEDINPFSLESNVLHKYFKQQKEVHYLDLLLGRMSSADRDLGQGFCTERFYKANN